MICLHITAHKDSAGITLEVDRLEREDASPGEANVINAIHDIIKAALESRGQDVLEIKKPWWKRWRG